MTTNARRIAGRKSQQNGKLFERIFERACARQGAAIIHVKDGGRQVSKNFFIREKTSCDWIVAHRSRVFICDTKHFSDTERLTRSRLVEHQVRKAFEFWQQGIASGYLIWFRLVDRVCFFTGEHLWNIWNGGKSMHFTEGTDLGKITEFRIEEVFKIHEKNLYRRCDECGATLIREGVLFREEPCKECLLKNVTTE